MPMEAVDEPSKWICRLTSTFGNGSATRGTGFLVNIPSKKFCIMTAGHNIIDKAEGRVINIKVAFQNGLTFTANADECFVSKIYGENPASESSEETSTSDYGLIAVDREKVDRSNPKLNPGGCAFNALLTDRELLRLEVSVHGYKGEKEGERSEELRQTKDTSPLQRVDDVALYYTKDTAGGVSGGPVFVAHEGHNTAVGIHNYHSRATRLTFRVMLEMLGWVEDYKLKRALEARKTKKDSQSAGVYLQGTKGSHPNIVARPIREHLNFVLVDVPKIVPDAAKVKPGATPLYERFVILPAQDLPAGALPAPDKPLHLLTAIEDDEEEGEEPWVGFRAVRTVPAKSNVFTVKGPGGIGLAGSQRCLKVQPSVRGRHCDCGCITQDQTIGLELGYGTPFKMS